MEMQGKTPIYTLAEYLEWQNSRLKRPVVTVCRIEPCKHSHEPKDDDAQD
jgi:hypothetical protein